MDRVGYPQFFGWLRFYESPNQPDAQRRTLESVRACVFLWRTPVACRVEALLDACSKLPCSTSWKCMKTEEKPTASPNMASFLRNQRTLESSRACEKLGTAYSVPRRQIARQNALPSVAAWTERAVPNFSPPRLEPGVFIPIVMPNAIETFVACRVKALQKPWRNPLKRKHRLCQGFCRQRRSQPGPSPALLDASSDPGSIVPVIPRSDVLTAPGRGRGERASHAVTRVILLQHLTYQGDKDYRLDPRAGSPII